MTGGWYTAGSTRERVGGGGCGDGSSVGGGGDSGAGVGGPRSGAGAGTERRRYTCTGWAKRAGAVGGTGATRGAAGDTGAARGTAGDTGAACGTTRVNETSGNRSGLTGAWLRFGPVSNRPQFKIQI